MNNFTKEELEIIEDCVIYKCCNSVKYDESPRYELLQKVQDILDDFYKKNLTAD